MSTITLAFELELNDDLSEEVLASITSALVMGLSRDSFKTVAMALAENNLHNGTTGTVNVKALDEAETAKAGANAALEALAVRCDERASTFDTVAANWGADDREQAYGDAGIASGYRGAAEYAREAIEAL
jgi:hypothetical protein